jgi:hypothetical protein
MCAGCSSSFDFVGSEQFPFVWGGLVHPRSSFSTWSVFVASNRQVSHDGICEGFFFSALRSRGRVARFGLALGVFRAPVSQCAGSRVLLANKSVRFPRQEHRARAGSLPSFSFPARERSVSAWSSFLADRDFFAHSWFSRVPLVRFGERVGLRIKDSVLPPKNSRPVEAIARSRFSCEKFYWRALVATI